MITTYMGVVVPSAILIPVSVGAQRYNKLKASRFLFLYLLIGGIINLWAIILARKGVNNLPLLHAYTVLEFLVVTLFYKKILANKLISQVLTTLLFLFPAWAILNWLFFQNMHTYNSYARSPEAILIMGMSIAYLIKEDHPDGISWTGNPFNWMNAGLMLYFSGSLFLFTFSNFIIPNRVVNAYIWNFHATLVLIMYLLFTAGFIKCRK